MDIKNFLKYAFASFAGALLVSACGGDDDGGSGSGGNSSQVKNENRNITGGKYATNNLEFPKLKGGTSKLIVYTGTSANEAKFGMNYAVEWDCDKKSNRWSCYRFDTSNSKTGKRSDNTSVVRWYPTDNLYPGSKYGDSKDPNQKYPFDRKNLTTSDFYEDVYSWGMDHGHLCPSADRLYSQEANIETFFMTNMQPQYNNFNAKGLWYYMEGKTRTWAQNLTSKDTLYIVKGGTIDSEDMILRRISNKLIVPGYFYVAYLMWRPIGGSTDRNDSSNYKAMALWFKHEDSACNAVSDFSPYMISIDELEQKTGIDFFCNLPDAVENKVESTLSKNAWQ